MVSAYMFKTITFGMTSWVTFVDLRMQVLVVWGTKSKRNLSETKVQETENKKRVWKECMIRGNCQGALRN